MPGIVTLRRSLLDGGLIPEARAWEAAVVGAGGTVSGARLSIISTLIRGLKTDSLWTLLDRLWLFAAENASSALVDIKALASATAVNSPTFTANQGYTGNGSTSYVNTGFAPATHGVQYAQNSAHILAYDRTNRTTTVGNPVLIGASPDGFGGSWFGPRPAGTTLQCVNQAGAQSYASLATAQGLHINTRTGAGGTAVGYYINGVPISLTGSQASATRTSLNMLVGGLNLSGTPSNFVTDQVAAVGLGAGLDATQAANMSARINAYMTAIGSNVY